MGIAVAATLILWGFLLAGVASANLFEGSTRLRLTWAVLTLGAYGALTIPGILIGPEKTVDAVAPVAALTLAAHLGRRDLARALRDWALVMGIALYTSLGVQAMWLVVNSFGGMTGLFVFLVAVLLPALMFEGILLVTRRMGRLRDNTWVTTVGLLLATTLGVAVFSFVLLNSATEPVWRVLFGLLEGILIGGALLMGLLTRPLVSAASGSRAAPNGRWNIAGALVQWSHAPILVSLALYIPLRLLLLNAAVF